MQTFQTADQFNSNWQFYLENEVKELANRDEFSIEHYADSEIFNPDVQNFIMAHSGMLTAVPAETHTQLALGFREKRQLRAIGIQIQTGFGQLKAWLKKVICELLGSIDWESKSTKEIISLVVLTLIPYLAATGGLPAALLPIVIAVIAKIMKQGIDVACSI